MAKLSSTLVVEPFGKIEIFTDTAGIRVKAGIRMKPAVEGAQTGLAIDGSNSMKKMFGADLPPFMPRNNLIEAVARSMAEALADFDTDGNTSVIYWACGVGGAEIEVLGEMDEAKAAKFAFNGPKKFGTGTKLAPALRHFAIEKFAHTPWSICVFVTDGIIEDLVEVQALTLSIAEQVSAGQRGFTKFVLIGLGEEVDEAQMIELDDMDYGGLKAQDGSLIDLWDHALASEMASLDEIFYECVSANSIIAPSATITDSTGRQVRKVGGGSYSDGLPALIEFICAPEATAFTLNIPGAGVFPQPLI
jgi:hypothetical protein